jgi:hypothetical protein
LLRHSRWCFRSGDRLPLQGDAVSRASTALFSSVAGVTVPDAWRCLYHLRIAGEAVPSGIKVVCPSPAATSAIARTGQALGPGLFPPGLSTVMAEGCGGTSTFPGCERTPQRQARPSCLLVALSTFLPRHFIMTDDRPAVPRRSRQPAEGSTGFSCMISLNTVARVLPGPRRGACLCTARSGPRPGRRCRAAIDGLPDNLLGNVGGVP